jgi:hypothetical protein
MTCYSPVCSVLAVLKPGGTVFIELPQLFGTGDCTRNSPNGPLAFQTDDGYDNDDADSVDQAENKNFDPSNDNDNNDDEDTSPLREGKLSIVWGDQGDAFDPITQVRQFKSRIRQVVPLRVFTVPEISALAQCAGFQVAAMYGALEHGVAMNDEESAYRFVCALRKPQGRPGSCTAEPVCQIVELVC